MASQIRDEIKIDSRAFELCHLQIGGSLGNTLVFSHLKFAAYPWPFLVNRTHHSVSVQGRAPSIFQPRHGSTAPLIYFNKFIGHSGIANEHDF